MKNSEIQVTNDMALLAQMMSDLNKCDDLYKPTNYWAHYEKHFLPELRKKGLKDFRRRKDSILSSFGSTDLLIRGKIKFKVSFNGVGRLTKFLNRFFDKLPFLSLVASEIVPAEVTPYYYQYVKAKFNKEGLDISKCPTSRFGNPEDIIEIDDGLWSKAHLQYCSMFIDATKHINFESDSIVCELGTGMGRNIELLAHLYKDATFLMFDIPPQLYVAHQYLTKVFGSRIIKYNDAVNLIPSENGTIPSKIKGKILILPTWRMPDWSATKINIFWNSASFQEMEPDVVLNYLKLVKNMSPEWIYINALPGGNYRGKWKPGKGGTKEPVSEKYYFEILNDKYRLKVVYDTHYFLRMNGYKSYIFEWIV